MAHFGKIFNSHIAHNDSTLLEIFLSLLLPHKCMQCSKIVSKAGLLCVNCWEQIEFITKPYCSTCGVPFEFDIEQELECGTCIKRKPYFDSAFSLFKYSKQSQKILHKLKYNDKPHMSKHLALWLFNRMTSAETKSYQYIIPIPIHRKRMRQRFYNQSALLADYFSKYSGIRFLPNALIKTKYHAPQTGLSQAERLSNVKNSFSINPKIIKFIVGYSVILIDDVYTTGSTLNECSKVLKEAGCKTIKAITVART